ncbi:MAG: hypothetical protein GC186_16515 [Rhodobacteraceae bacterium]|nr:hypothetical protein [Paracoccaceae bacterium]
MSNQVSYAERSFTLAAGSTLKYPRQATFIDCLASSAAFKIKLDNSPESDFNAGLQFEPIGGFQDVEIRNPNAVPITLTLGFGIGNMRDNRVTLNAGQTLPVRQGSPDVFNTLHYISVPVSSAILLRAANPLRADITIWAADGNAGLLYITSGAALDQNYGIILNPGQSLTLTNAADIYAFNASPTNTAACRVFENAWSA